MGKYRKKWSLRLAEQLESPLTSVSKLSIASWAMFSQSHLEGGCSIRVRASVNSI